MIFLALVIVALVPLVVWGCITVVSWAGPRAVSRLERFQHRHEVGYRTVLALWYLIVGVQMLLTGSDPMQRLMGAFLLAISPAFIVRAVRARRELRSHR